MPRPGRSRAVDLSLGPRRHAGQDRRRLPGQGPAGPATPGEIVRRILDNLAVTFAARIDDVQRLSGRRIDVHVVGGGARNTLLCRLIADACGHRVVAGPVESTALENVLVQARTHGRPPR